MGDDQPRPGISCDHSTFSVLDQRSASLACVPTGFDSGPRNCGHALSCPSTGSDTNNSAHANPHSGRDRLLPTKRQTMKQFFSLRLGSSFDRSLLIVFSMAHLRSSL